MDSQWRDKRLYPFLGILMLLSLLYLNFNTSNGSLSFPVFLWQPKMGFVSTDSAQFIIINDGDDDGESAFYVNGWNSYWLMMESVWSSSRSKVSEMLKRGSQMGLTVCRTWPFSDGHGPDALQVSPGVFNERVFKGLDYVIVEARSNRIRLILSLVNNLVAFGGKTQYVKWAKEAGVNVSSSDDSFFSNPVIKDYFKAYIKAVVKRKNSLSGVRYSEELAIFRLGAHVSDGDIAPRKPVLFTEVGSSRHVDEKGVFDRDVLSKTVYDKIYESVKKRRAGAFIWQLLAEGVDGYSDNFSFVPQDYPSTYKLINNNHVGCKVFLQKAKDKERLNRRIPALISCK